MEAVVDGDHLIGILINSTTITAVCLNSNPNLGATGFVGTFYFLRAALAFLPEWPRTICPKLPQLFVEPLRKKLCKIGIRSCSGFTILLLQMS